MSDSVRVHYADIVIVGGGCYGSYYVRQLLRARHANALSFDRLVVVDRDPACAVFHGWGSEPRVTMVRQEWASFFDEYLDTAAGTGARGGDAIVPSPLMPHLMFDWLLRRARARWPRRTVERRPLRRALAVPWQQAMPSGTHVVSFAEWMCPVNCIEPAKCPVTRGPRSWSMPVAVQDYVNRERATAAPLAGPVILHCEHRAYGVGMFDTQRVLDGDALVERAGSHGAADVLVGTVSHCHGALDVLHVGHAA
jgi:hypothetical protein